MSKSNCCGAKYSDATLMYMYNVCNECVKRCDLIPDDIMSKKELLAFAKKWGEQLDFNPDVDSGTIFNPDGEYLYIFDFLEELEKVIKAIKEHL